VAPGSSVEADFDEYVLCGCLISHTDPWCWCSSDQNAEAFNQIMYKTARDELAKISKEYEVM
jgi:CDGSH-type Zn-finger protein